jgi:hypothetical protein
MTAGSGPVYGAGVATCNPLPYNFANILQQALEEKARDEAESNDPKFAEFIASAAIDMSDVSVVIAETVKGSDDSYLNALNAAGRIVADWIVFRVNSMPAWERDEVKRKLLGDEQ